jgi:hypothetical protein
MMGFGSALILVIIAILVRLGLRQQRAMREKPVLADGWKNT